MQNLSSSLRMFGENYTVCFVDVRIMSIVDEMMSLNIFTAGSESNYARYILDCKIIITLQVISAMIVNLRKTSEVFRTKRMKHGDEAMLYNTSEQNILLMVYAVEASEINNDNHTV